MKVILFGAGADGKKALYEIGKKHVKYFVDNGTTGEYDGVKILLFEDFLKRYKNELIVITSSKYEKEIAKQLDENGVNRYLFYKKGMFATNMTDERLDAEQWGDIYNQYVFDCLKFRIEKKQYSVQTNELLNITKENDTILEIGCGSGETSIALAKEKRNVVALDYNRNTMESVLKVANELGVVMEGVCADATQPLPFVDHHFTYVFQAGLLEHFYKDQRISMLSNWKSICKYMVSLIPNANAVAYRIGKEMAEKASTWEYGLEMPQQTLRKEFEEAGFVDIIEYTIGSEIALNFLPQNHYLRIALQMAMNEGYNLDDYSQGYLLVTIGRNPELND